MSLTPWNPKRVWLDPFHPFDDLEREMGSLMNFPQLSRKNVANFPWNPAVDIFDGKENIKIKADLPGITKDQIDVTCDAGVLTIKGEKTEENETDEKGCVRSERFHGSFQRSFTLPAGVDASNVDATYKNGVLEIIIPKKEELKTKMLKVNIK